MEDQRPVELRNDPEKAGAAIRKKAPLEFEQFLREWRRRLQEGGWGWEGDKAVAELRGKEKKGKGKKEETSLLDFLLCKKRSETDWQAEDLFGRIVDEMRAYRTEAEDRIAREYFSEVDEFLEGIAEKVQKKEERTRIPRLKRVLADLRREVERTQKKAGRLMKERRNWHFGIWQHLWPEVPRKNLVLRKKDLDTRLQLELGKAFAYYLKPEGVSLETVARLIFLAYRVGGLLHAEGGWTGMTLAGGILKVRNIRENLRYGGLHKAESFLARPK